MGAVKEMVLADRLRVSDWLIDGRSREWIGEVLAGEGMVDVPSPHSLGTWMANDEYKERRRDRVFLLDLEAGRLPVPGPEVDLAGLSMRGSMARLLRVMTRPETTDELALKTSRELRGWMAAMERAARRAEREAAADEAAAERAAEEAAARTEKKRTLLRRVSLGGLANPYKARSAPEWITDWYACKKSGFCPMAVPAGMTSMELAWTLDRLEAIAAAAAHDGAADDGGVGLAAATGDDADADAEAPRAAAVAAAFGITSELVSTMRQFYRVASMATLMRELRADRERGLLTDASLAAELELRPNLEADGTAMIQATLQEFRDIRRHVTDKASGMGGSAAQMLAALRLVSAAELEALGLPADAAGAETDGRQSAGGEVALADEEVAVADEEVSPAVADAAADGAAEMQDAGEGADADGEAGEGCVASGEAAAPATPPSEPEPGPESEPGTRKSEDIRGNPRGPEGQAVRPGIRYHEEDYIKPREDRMVGWL